MGFAAGLFGSLVGVGGGVIIVPALVGLCPGVPQRSAPPSSLPRTSTFRGGGGRQQLSASTGTCLRQRRLIP